MDKGQLKTKKVSEIELNYENKLAYRNSELFTGVAYINHPNGRLECELPYNNGIKIGIHKRWNDKGRLIEKNSYEAGLKKIFKQFYDTGELQIRKTYINDTGDSLRDEYLLEEYFKSGVLKIKRHNTGIMTVFLEGTFSVGVGSKSYNRTYKNGKLIKQVEIKKI